MAVEKVIVAAKEFKNNWWSVTENTGRVINISTINKKSQQAENQKLAGILANINVGEEVEIDVRPWEGKFYGNDPKSGGAGGAKSFTPADKSFSSAQYAAQAAGSMLALQKDVTFAKFEELANQIHTWILSKKSA